MKHIVALINYIMDFLYIEDAIVDNPGSDDIDALGFIRDVLIIPDTKDEK